jgi:hypothetical protein
MYRIFQPFRLQSPSVAPTAWPVFHSRTYRRNRFDERVPPTKQGSAGVSWASPLGCRLAATIGRIEFVSLRTSRSPPDALHLPSRGRSFARLRQPGRPPTGTRTLLVQYTCNRTAPGGSRGVTGCAAMTGCPAGFGKTREGDPQVRGVDRVTPGLPPGAFGEERARIKCAPYNEVCPSRMRRPSTQETLGVGRGRSSGQRPWMALSTDSKFAVR